MDYVSMPSFTYTNGCNPSSKKYNLLPGEKKADIRYSK